MHHSEQCHVMFTATFASNLFVAAKRSDASSLRPKCPCAAVWRYRGSLSFRCSDHRGAIGILNRDSHDFAPSHAG
jgi:hypothetical protein